MRKLGLKSIVIAAGLALAGAGSAATAQPTPQATPAASAAAPDAASANATTPDASATPAVADPTLTADGRQKVAPNPKIGQPQDGLFGLQEQVTPTGIEAHGFHNHLLMPIITIISIFVLLLLIWVVIRYRQAANPVPSKTSHNTAIEVIWTVVPVLILVFIAIPSIKLLAHQYAPAPDNAVTLKAIGNQWYWSYEYPDNGDVTFTANMLKEKDQVQPGERYRTAADGPELLATDNRVVLPVGVPIRLITTASDVIHSWAVPAFWIKLDAIPGRLNETQFTIEKPGLYFGQCSELCGARHALHADRGRGAARRPEFAAVGARSQGGTMPGEGEQTVGQRLKISLQAATDADMSKRRARPAAVGDDVEMRARIQCSTRQRDRGFRNAPDAVQPFLAKFFFKDRYRSSTTIAFQAPHDHTHDHDAAHHKPSFFTRWFLSTNHKDIGTLYLIFAVCRGNHWRRRYRGMMRLELAEPGIQYLQSWSSFMVRAKRGDARPELPPVERDDHRARPHHGVFHGHARDDRRLRQLVRAAHDRRARHGLSAHEQYQLLAAPWSRLHHAARFLVHAGIAFRWRAWRGHRLDGLCPAFHHMDQPGTRGRHGDLFAASGGRGLNPRRGQFHRHHSSTCARPA